MSSPVAVLGSIAIAYAVNRLTTSLTGSETLGMIAGMAVGGWAGGAISGAMAAGPAVGAATSATQAGSALGVAGAVPLGGAATAVPVATSPIAAQAASAGSGAILPGAAASVSAPGAAASLSAPASSGGGGFLGGLQSFAGGFDPNELLKVAAGGIAGMAKSKQKEKDREIDKDYQRLLEERDEEEKRRYYSQGAFGVTNAGEVVPINAGGQLSDMNKRLGYQPHTSLGSMTNISTITRPEGGYLSRFGRFGPQSTGGQSNA